MLRARLLSPFCSGSAEAKDFVVVIDPGHGGHDPGAVGKNFQREEYQPECSTQTWQTNQEELPDVKVIYTRDRDIFIPLDRRAEIANNAKADLFISIHTNALAKTGRPKEPPPGHWVWQNRMPIWK